ncbi:MAG: fructosamine kinase family protein [Pseudomonadota bacterium]
MWNAIAHQIAATTGQPFSIARRSGVGGGDINAAYRIEGNGQRYFVKVNSAARDDMFSAEAAGLAEIAQTQTIRVPQPLCHGNDADYSWLVLEYLDITRSGSPARLGELLAALHRVTAKQFGWHRANTIGETPQPNEQTNDWIAFWREQRIGFQLQLAARNGYGGTLQRKGEKLLEKLPAFFAGYAPQPSLLHGDLWGGNYGYDEHGAPLIFDPAVYYGDREADLAMTELFGGFGAAFYSAYDAAFPRDPGYCTRKDLYNLYHVLNHANLFGGGYARQAEGMIERLLAETS